MHKLGSAVEYVLLYVLLSACLCTAASIYPYLARFLGEGSINSFTELKAHALAQARAQAQAGRVANSTGGSSTGGRRTGGSSTATVTSTAARIVRKLLSEGG